MVTISYPHIPSTKKGGNQYINIFHLARKFEQEATNVV